MKDVAALVREARVTREASRNYRLMADRIEADLEELPPYMGLTRRTYRHWARIARHAAQAEFFNPAPDER